jgi:hypothetical protein
MGERPFRCPLGAGYVIQERGYSCKCRASFA